MCSDQDVIQHGHIAKQPDILKCSGDALPGDPVGRPTGDVLTFEDKSAGRGPIDSSQDIKEGCLARTIGAYDAQYPPFLNGQAQISHCLHPSEVH
jgi:hypothetical protein